MSSRIDISISQSESHWVSSTDLMSGLMLIFMFISIAYMINASSERDQMYEHAQEWAITKDSIYNALYDEFKDDLQKWNAEIIADSLIIRFPAPTVFFHKGETNIQSRFKDILADFFPRYINRLISFKKSISEIRIEGHTSSEWNQYTPTDKAYFNNMALSQGRTMEVLTYCLKQINVDSLYDWTRDVIISTGMSSSRLVYRHGVEDKGASRRVEFRVRTNADEKLSLILYKSEKK